MTFLGKILALTPFLAIIAATCGGCASGPKYSKMTMPAIPQGDGRIVFYRGTSMVGSAVGADIRLNNQVVGQSSPGTFFFVDHPAGDCEIATSTEAEHKLTFSLPAQSTLYVQTHVTMGVFIGQIWPELVDGKAALTDLPDLSYSGPMSNGTPSSPSN